jgi:hypothetical protein
MNVRKVQKRQCNNDFRDRDLKEQLLLRMEDYIAGEWKANSQVYDWAAESEWSATYESKDGAADKVRKKKKRHTRTAWHFGREPLGTIGLK